MLYLFLNNLKEFENHQEEPKDNDMKDIKYINKINGNYKESNIDISQNKEISLKIKIKISL